MEFIATATTDDLLSAVRSSWDELHVSVGAARAEWLDRTLEAEDPTEKAWSPRQAAWHAVAGEFIRLAYLRYILAEKPNAPADMMAFAASPAAGDAGLSALRTRSPEIRTVDDMLAVCTQLRDSTATFVRGLSESDLVTEATLSDFMHGYLGGHGQTANNDVRGSLLHGVVHLQDHAHQIAACAR